MEYKVGIDLGTTNSCIGVWRNNKVEIIPNSQGERTTPSVIFFKKENEILIGKLAKNQIKNYENVIYDVKRLIGKKYSDKTIQEDKKLWTFKIKKDNEDKPKIIVNNKEYYPEEISAMILKKLKEEAEDYLGKQIKEAVITVPANFGDHQRKATIKAAEQAGLNVIQLINEPTAAAIAFGLENPSNEKKNICVFDFGGGTLDVTILTVKNKHFTVLSSEGDSHLGGGDIDNKLVEYCIDEFKKETGIDVSENQKAIKRLKMNCEKIKIELSGTKESNIDIDALAEGKDFFLTIHRGLFENLCKSIFQRCIKLLEETLKKSSILKNKIDDIVVVGGSSRIPKVQEMISDFFQGKKCCKGINPEEAISFGAAIIAISKDVHKIAGLEDLIVADVLPKSLGIRVQGGKMAKIIEKNTPLPCEGKRRFANSSDYLESVVIKVYEGENEFVDENDFLGEFEFKGIKSAKRGETAVWVTFKVNDRFSILEIFAKEEGTKNSLLQTIQIKK